MIENGYTAGQPLQSDLPAPKRPRSFVRTGYARFADVLSRTGRATGAAAVTSGFGTEAKSYSLGTNVGGDAVRFDARPIVGPVSENMAEADAPAEAPQTTIPSRGDALMEVLLSPDFASRGFLSDALTLNQSPAIWNVANEAQPLHPVRPQQVQLTTSLNSFAPAVVALGTTASFISPTGQMSGSAAPPKQGQLAGTLTSSAHSFAQVVVFSNEIRVSVRGAKLQAGEVDELLRDIRLSLNSHGLSNHKIIFKQDGREA